MIYGLRGGAASFWSSRDGEGEETREEDDANEGDEENIDINATF